MTDEQSLADACEEAYADAYPTDEELKRIREWPIKKAEDGRALANYVRGLWYYDAGDIDEDGMWRPSTWGWYGNEELIGALEKNQLWWVLYWQSSRRGGHFEFDLDRVK